MKKLKENEKDQLVSKLIQYLLLKDGYNPDVEDSFDNFVNEHHVIKKTKDSKKKNSIKLAIDKQKRKLIAGAAILGAFIPTYLMLNTATLKDGDNSKYIEKILYQPDPFTFTNELFKCCYNMCCFRSYWFYYFWIISCYLGSVFLCSILCRKHRATYRTEAKN